MILELKVREGGMFLMQASEIHKNNIMYIARGHRRATKIMHPDVQPYLSVFRCVKTTKFNEPESMWHWKEYDCRT